MAEYHIREDLQEALNANGCGSKKDWEKVGEIINECIGEQNGIIPSFVASILVSSERNKIRKKCQAISGEKDSYLLSHGDEE